jgi:hypothetical protein
VGDIVADIEGRSYVAECKGGVINTKHAGQLSRLRKGLCEAVGLSLATEPVEGRRQFAVVPKTATSAVVGHGEIAGFAGLSMSKDSIYRKGTAFLEKGQPSNYRVPTAGRRRLQCSVDEAGRPRRNRRP